jgi:hypothetical protein
MMTQISTLSGSNSIVTNRGVGTRLDWTVSQCVWQVDFVNDMNLYNLKQDHVVNSHRHFRKIDTDKLTEYFCPPTVCAASQS